MTTTSLWVPSFSAASKGKSHSICMLGVQSRALQTCPLCKYLHRIWFAISFWHLSQEFIPLKIFANFMYIQRANMNSWDISPGHIICLYVSLGWGVGGRNVVQGCVGKGKASEMYLPDQPLDTEPLSKLSIIIPGKGSALQWKRCLMTKTSLFWLFSFGKEVHLINSFGLAFKKWWSCARC